MTDELLKALRKTYSDCEMEVGNLVRDRQAKPPNYVCSRNRDCCINDKCEKNFMCSHFRFKVWDFDEIKERYMALKPEDKNQLASVDCLLFSKIQNVVYFIEFKERKPRANVTDEKEWLEFMDENFLDKIVDSHALLVALAKEGHVSDDFVKNLLNKEKVKIRYLIVLSSSSRDFVTKFLTRRKDLIQALKLRFVSETDLIESKKLESLLKTGNHI